MVSSRQSAATKSGGFDNADSEWSHVAWAMLMPCGSRKGGIVKGSQKNRQHCHPDRAKRRGISKTTAEKEILRCTQNDSAMKGNDNIAN